MSWRRWLSISAYPTTGPLGRTGTGHTVVASRLADPPDAVRRSWAGAVGAAGRVHRTAGGCGHALAAAGQLGGQVESALLPVADAREGLLDAFAAGGAPPEALILAEVLHTGCST